MYYNKARGFKKYNLRVGKLLSMKKKVDRFDYKTPNLYMTKTTKSKWKEKWETEKHIWYQSNRQKNNFLNIYCLSFEALGGDLALKDC